MNRSTLTLRVGVIADARKTEHDSDNRVVLTGVRTAPLPSLDTGVNRLLDRLYWGIPLPQKPITEKHIPKEERNDLICERYAEGETLDAIGTTFGLSVQRVHQIIHRWCT